MSYRALWQILNDSSEHTPKEIVAEEINEKRENLFNGLLQYKSRRTPVGQVLKEEKDLSGVQSEFNKKLALFLELDETQSYQLYCSYFRENSRGQQRCVEQLLEIERHSQALLYKIRDYYYTERLYVIKCLKIIFSFWNMGQHEYKTVFSKFVLSIADDSKFYLKILEQFENLTLEDISLEMKNDSHLNDRQESEWALQNLKEQCAILEVMLLYFRDFEIGCKDFICLFQKFKRHGYGRQQTYRRILDASAEKLLLKISYLEVLIILEIIDMDNFLKASQDGKYSELSLYKEKTDFIQLSILFEELGTTDVCHGPLVLAWTVIRTLYLSESELNSAVIKKMGTVAIHLKTFDFLNSLVDTEPFNGTSVIAVTSQHVVYTLLQSVLLVFEEGTLGNTEMMIEISTKLLKQRTIAQDVLEKGFQDGIGSLIQSSLEFYPQDYETFMNFLISLAHSCRDCAEQVASLFRNIAVYTEFLDRNCAADLAATQSPTVWKLARDKVVYPSGEFIMPKGTYGELLKCGKGYFSKQLGQDLQQYQLIKWNITYDGWQIIKCEVMDLLQQITQGAGMVSMNQISRVTIGLQLVKELMMSIPSSTTKYLGIVDHCYQILQRFCSFTPAPLDLLAVCIDCLSCAINEHPTQVWHKLSQTGVLPYLTENIDNMEEVISGRSLTSGQYGSILAGYECSQGRYPLTSAILEFILNSVSLMYKANKEDKLLAPVLFLLREVFPVYHKWRYYSSSRREQIGQKCLEIFHRIFNFTPLKESSCKRPSLQDTCLYSLLYTEAGRALLDQLSSANEGIDHFLVQQESLNEGNGTELIHLVQLSFSVLNRLLKLKTADLPLSPVEHALSSQPAGRQTHHIVATIALYIFHKHNSKLPILSTYLLKRLSVISPMSILACLGNDAQAVRDQYLSRLKSMNESVRLKVVILELLSVSVETQPGLIEMFLNVQTSDNAGGKKDLSLGNSSCLQTVMELMDEKIQGTHLCPPDLLCACCQFIYSLWHGRRETAIDVLRKRESFWSSLCSPLMNDMPTFDQGDGDFLNTQAKIRTVAYVMKILAYEIYSTESRFSEKLKKILREFDRKNQLQYWSKYGMLCMCFEGEARLKNEEMLNENSTFQLLSAWKTLLVTSSKYQGDIFVIRDQLKDEILLNLMAGLQSQFEGGLSLMNMKLASLSSAVFFTLMNQWYRHINNIHKLTEEIHRAITNTCANSETLIPSVQIGLLASLLVILLNRNLLTSKSFPSEVFINLLPSICSVLQQSTLQLPTVNEIMNQSSQEKMNTTTDVKFKLQSVCCCLVDELIKIIPDSTKWVSIFQEYYLLNLLLTSLETYLKSKLGLPYVSTLMTFLIAVAKFEKGAEALAFSGLTQHTCVALLSLYENGESIGNKMTSSVNQISSSKKHLPEMSWQKIFIESIQLYTMMLYHLRYSFIEDIFNLIGAHQDKFRKGLEICRITLTETALQEAEAICGLIYQVSFFRREWMLHLQDSLTKLLTSMVSMCQTFISLLVRPKYLQHIISQHAGDPTIRKDLRTTILPPVLQPQASTDDIEKPTTHLLTVQNYMLRIISRCLSTLRQFTPGLCEVLLDQSMDVSEYDAFLGINFSTPALDHSVEITFGTLLSCNNMCMRLLNKLDPRSVSPQKSPDTTLSQYIDKSLILNNLESSLYLIMSQAAQHLRDPNLHAREKQILKMELGSELNLFLSSMNRYIRRGAPTSPSPSGSGIQQPRTVSPRSQELRRSVSQSSVINSQEHAFFRLVQEFVQKVLR